MMLQSVVAKTLKSRSVMRGTNRLQPVARYQRACYPP
jgi:hypothetical protein